ncbi:MAG: aminotransferase class III-fold pyridoxal phosphate-dependent enzyme, partial [Anaerovoracaceae bacterium]
GLIYDGGAKPDSAGVTKGTAKDTLLAVYNNIDSVKEHFEENKDEIAAVIIEPVAANMGVVLPKPGFLEDLREICTANGTVLIFDEVITGFRLHPGGAQTLLGVKPDMSTFGKIIGGGLPVGCYGGKREIMEMVAPLGPVYQAGTLAGNPVAMAAGIAQLTYLRDHKEVYEKINRLTDKLFNGIEEIITKAGAKCTYNKIGSIGSLFFTDIDVVDFETAKSSDVNKYADYFKHMLGQGSYIAPAQFEAMFMSYAHTEAEIDKTLGSISEFFGV